MVLTFKVIGTDTNRSATYDFLLTFLSNHGPISYRFRDKRWKSKFFHLGIGYRCWGSKTGMMGQSGRERSLTISSTVWIQYTNVTDRRTSPSTRDICALWRWCPDLHSYQHAKQTTALVSINQCAKFMSPWCDFQVPMEKSSQILRWGMGTNFNTGPLLVLR